ncbi:unnamed protein product [Merluccius merluccius]
MEAGSMRGESTDAIIMDDDSPSDGRETRDISQSDIPGLSLCPPDSVYGGDVQLTVIPSEGERRGSCGNLSPASSSSSFQLYHQVPQEAPGMAYHLAQPQRCSCPGHKSSPGHDCHSNPTGPHADCAVGEMGANVGQSSSSANQASCHRPVRCQWPHGSHGRGAHKAAQRHVVTVRAGGLYWIPKNYSQVILDYPLAAVVGYALVLLGCSLAGLLIGPLPDFSDPLLGFEPRGTNIGVRQSSLDKLQESTGPGKVLSYVPWQVQDRPMRSGDVSGGQDLTRLRTRRMLNRDSSPDTFLCDAPGERFAQLVFRSGNSASLWSLKAIHSMCEMEQAMIRSQARFQDLCQQHARGDSGEKVSKGGCCPSWSLGNYLAVHTNASSCLSLTSHQVSESLGLLRYCAPFYHNGQLVEACVKRPKHGGCASVPSRCKQSLVVFHILHFLVDKDFVGPETVEYQVPSLKYSLLILPVEKAALILLGSCSNHVFTFADFWNLQLSQNPSASLEKRVHRAMQEVGYLILASGLTSSVAFFSGYLSSITAIRCFSIYLGTASLISSLSAIVWLPCSFILRERYTVASSSMAIQRWKPCCAKNPGGFWDTSSRKRCLFTIAQRVRQDCDKGAGEYHNHHHQQQQREKQPGAGGVGGGRGPEQYELQPLACRLSDSFENSTCTSKLSNRLSVLSDEIEDCRRDVERNRIEAESEEQCSHQHKVCHPPPALQTSSPYKESTLRPVAQPQGDADKDILLCKTCRGQTGGVKLWRRASFSSSSSMEETVVSQTLETIDQPSLCKEGHSTEDQLQLHQHSCTRLLYQSQSSCDGLEDSNETCLSDIEPGPSNTQQAEEEEQLQPGHLNGKRDTLRLSLKETVYETSSGGSGKGRTSQSEEVVIIPNSKPDLPDVWIKRDGQREHADYS